MPADTWAGIERHETKGLRGSRAYHFPRIDIERVTKPRHLVGHADIYSPKVFSRSFAASATRAEVTL